MGRMRIDVTGHTTTVTGDPGVSRNDGEPSKKVTVVSVDGGAVHSFEIVSTTERPAPTVTPVSPTSWEFTPGATQGQSFLLQLTVDGAVSRRTYRIPLTNGLLLPTPFEAADPTASIATGGDADKIAASDDNAQGISGLPALTPNYEGYAPHLERLFREVDTLMSGGGGGGDTVKISVADTASGYLGAKIQADTGLQETILSPGANEILQITPVYGAAASTICEGDDARLSDARAPIGPAGGDLSGTYPNPAVSALTETGGPTQLTLGAVVDGEYLLRSGGTIVSGPGGGGGTSLPVVDTTSIVEGSSDPTKEMRIEVDGLTTATTRVLTMADQDIDLTPDTGTYPAATHATRHQNGGADEINVAGLSGLLADAQYLNILKNGTLVGTREGLNLIEGTNITLTLADDAGNNRVNATITAAGGGAGASNQLRVPDDRYSPTVRYLLQDGSLADTGPSTLASLTTAGTTARTHQRGVDLQWADGAGSSAYNGPSDALLSQTGDLSVEIGVCMDYDSVPGSDPLYIASVGTTGETAPANITWAITLDPSTKEVILFHESGAGTNQSFATGIVLQEGVFYCLTITRTDVGGGDVVYRLYLDGKLMSTSGNITAPTDGSSGTLQLLGTNALSAGAAKGALAWLQIYGGTVLSDAQVEDLYAYVTGGLSTEYREVSANTALNTADRLIGVNTSGGAYTMTLPDRASFTSGATITVQDISGDAGENPVTIAAAGSDTFENGIDEKALTTSFGAMTFRATSLGWREVKPA